MCRNKMVGLWQINIILFLFSPSSNSERRRLLAVKHEVKFIWSNPNQKSNPNPIPNCNANTNSNLDSNPYYSLNFKLSNLNIVGCQGQIQGFRNGAT